jgi:hypothetical protein
MLRVLLSLFVLAFLSCITLPAWAQEADSVARPEAIEKLKYKQQPGLALAASKIFFSDKRYSISGFGEFNYVHYRGPKDTNVGDLELYYTNLYRYATFFGYRFTDKIIWNSEFQIEYLHDGNREGKTEIVIEAFMDFLVSEYFKARIGFYPLTIGYVNNNDEPVMFYSVNRSEVERLITPSTWIEFGAMFYGSLTEDLSYALGISQGLNAADYLGGTWIRQGRQIRLDVPRSLSFNPQITYTGLPRLTLSASGYFGHSGQGARLPQDGQEVELKAPIRLGTGYIKYDWKNLRFVTVGTLGTLGDTENLFQYTAENRAVGEVIGARTYGWLAEMGYDFLPLLRKNREVRHRHSRLVDTREMKLPLFVRYERLNTHARVAEALQMLPRVQNDLDIWTVGVNFNTRENMVLKANYQFRNNRYTGPLVTTESDVVEFGIGFIF